MNLKNSYASNISAPIPEDEMIKKKVRNGFFIFVFITFADLIITLFTFFFNFFIYKFTMYWSFINFLWIFVIYVFYF